MQGYPWKLNALLDSRPNLGQLLDLCEENYHRILRLAPRLPRMQGRFLSRLSGSMDLYLEIQEQTPYTTLVHLTYYFANEQAQAPDPDATLRIYHDSRQAELLDLRQQALPLNRGFERPTLVQKWRANLFLAKWLGYCLAQGHGFSDAPLLGEVVAPLELID